MALNTFGSKTFAAKAFFTAFHTTVAAVVRMSRGIYVSLSANAAYYFSAAASMFVNTGRKRR